MVADAAVTPAVRSALVGLYNATGGASWSLSMGWRDFSAASSDPCTSSWFGVSCGAGDAVVALALSSNNLTGTLPSTVSALTAVT
jgi:hypothetical protein